MTFNGFPSGKLSYTRLPSLFFKDLLPQIDNLEELKVILYALWQVTRQEGEIRCLRETDLINDPIFMAGMGDTPAEQKRAVRQGLERAESRGVFITAATPDEEGQTLLYFFNSPRGKTAVQAVKEGRWHPASGRSTITLDIERPNIFQLYEENIGPLTPLIADTLKKAEKIYPERWIAQAVEIAVQNNVRKWNYIEAILTSWQESGRDERQDRRHTEKDRRAYLKDKFAGFLED